MSKRLFRLACFVFQWSIAYGLSSCGNDIAEIRAITNEKNLPVQTSRNADYTYTEGGKLKNKLKAVRLDQYAGENSYIEVHEGFEMIFFDSTEQEEATLVAMNGRYIEKERKLLAWEDVHLFNIKGDMLETEELIFAQDSGKIYTDKYVRITTASGIIHGQGMESNDSFTKYRILKPSGDLYVNESDSIGIQ